MKNHPARLEPGKGKYMLYFILNERAVMRITKRVLDGGHEVPITKIISRYYKSILNASKAICFVDRAYVYDNSVENQKPRLLYRTTDGMLAKRYCSDMPEWAAEMLPR